VGITPQGFFMRVDGFEVTLDKDQTIAFLRACHVREGTSWFGPVWEVKYADKWLPLSTTDLKDDVGLGCPKDKFPFEKIMRACRFGARITDRRFAVIDRWSDG
jgi:hypothetical protein